MEKRLIGGILTLLGALGLIYGALTFVNHTENTYNVKVIVTSLVIGLIFFSAGMGLIRSTRDTIKNDEHVS